MKKRSVAVILHIWVNSANGHKLIYEETELLCCTFFSLPATIKLPSHKRGNNTECKPALSFKFVILCDSYQPHCLLFTHNRRRQLLLRALPTGIIVGAACYRRENRVVFQFPHILATTDNTRDAAFVSKSQRSRHRHHFRNREIRLSSLKSYNWNCYNFIWWDDVHKAIIIVLWLSEWQVTSRDQAE